MDQARIEEIYKQVAILKQVSERLALVGIPSGPILEFVKELETRLVVMQSR